MVAFNRSDLLFIQKVRQGEIHVSHDGRLRFQYDVSDEGCAKLLRDLIIREIDEPAPPPQGQTKEGGQ